MTDFDEKLKRLKEDHRAEFSLTAKSINEVTELFELVRQSGVTWFSGESIEPSGRMFELIQRKMQTYPEKRFVLNFRNGFDLKKQKTIFCTWEHK